MSAIRTIGACTLGLGVVSYRGIKRVAPYVARGAIVVGCAAASVKFSTAIAVGAGVYYGLGLASRVFPATKE